MPPGMCPRALDNANSTATPPCVPVGRPHTSHGNDHIHILRHAHRWTAVLPSVRVCTREPDMTHVFCIPHADWSSVRSGQCFRAFGTKYPSPPWLPIAIVPATCPVTCH